VRQWREQVTEGNKMIEISNVSKAFGDVQALKDVTLAMKEGEFFGMVGTNGAGKSTLLRMVSGVLKPDCGEILIDGEHVYDNERIKNRIFFIPDDPYFLPNSTADDMADFYYSTYIGFDKNIYKYYMNKLGLATNRKISNFSKGMKRQAITILALSCRTDYIFFDETFDGLDPVMRRLVKDEIIKDTRERKTTVVITSHSLRELEDVCDQLTLLHKGGVIFESDVKNLKTSLFKLQLAFSDEFDESRFEGIDRINYSQKGRVASFIVRGEKEETIAKAEALSPLLIDVLPLSLEEVFVYEMEALGYAFNEVLTK
jgi:ABC-2 type transport system ATP-binding protein